MRTTIPVCWCGLPALGSGRVECRTYNISLQKGAKGERNNNSAGKQHGKARAEQVQVENKKGEKDPSPSKGSKSQGKHKGWSTKGEHKAKGHR